MQNEARVDENQTLLVSAASPLRERGDLPPQEFDGRRMKLGLMRIRHSWCPGAPCASPEIPPSGVQRCN